MRAHCNSHVSSSLISIFSSDVLLCGVACIFRLKLRAFFSFKIHFIGKRLREVFFETKVCCRGFLMGGRMGQSFVCACAVYHGYDIASNFE